MIVLGRYVIKAHYAVKEINAELVVQLKNRKVLISALPNHLLLNLSYSALLLNPFILSCKGWHYLNE